MRENSGNNNPMRTIPFLSLLFAAYLITGCQTDTGDAGKDRAGRVTNAVLTQVFNSALNYGLTEGQQYLTGQNGQDAAAGAFTAAAGLVSSDAIASYVKAYAGPQLGGVTNALVQQANPQTPSDTALVANTIGAAFQLAANQLAE